MDDVAGVRAHPQPGHFDVDLGAPRPRLLQLLEDVDAGALAQHHAGATLAEGPAGVDGHDAQRLPALHGAIGDAGLGAAGHRHVGEPGADHVKGLADGVRGRGTGAGDGEGGAGEAVLHGDVTGRGIEHDTRDGEGMEPLGALGIDPPVVVVEGVLSARPGADDGGGTGAEAVGELEARVGDGLARGHQGKLGKAIQERELGFFEMITRVEALDLRPDRYDEPFGADVGEGGDGRAAFADRLPELVLRASQGRDHAHPGHHDSSHRLDL